MKKKSKPILVIDDDSKETLKGISDAQKAYDDLDIISWVTPEMRIEKLRYLRNKAIKWERHYEKESIGNPKAKDMIYYWRGYRTRISERLFKVANPTIEEEKNITFKRDSKGIFRESPTRIELYGVFSNDNSLSLFNRLHNENKSKREKQSIYSAIYWKLLDKRLIYDHVKPMQFVSMLQSNFSCTIPKLHPKARTAKTKYWRTISI